MCNLFIVFMGEQNSGSGIMSGHSEAHCAIMKFAGISANSGEQCLEKVPGKLNIKLLFLVPPSSSLESVLIVLGNSWKGRRA